LMQRLEERLQRSAKPEVRTSSQSGVIKKNIASDVAT
jgi:hypothetical protein